LIRIAVAVKKLSIVPPPHRIVSAVVRNLDLRAVREFLGVDLRAP